jgi:hypothetical protein
MVWRVKYLWPVKIPNALNCFVAHTLAIPRFARENPHFALFKGKNTPSGLA